LTPPLSSWSIRKTARRVPSRSITGRATTSVHRHDRPDAIEPRLLQRFVRFKEGDAFLAEQAP
jgi:hypothetical protein